jgi:branched-chain amino acid transport system substrate-binding protein
LYFVVPGLPRSKEYQAFLSRFKKVYKAAPKSAHFAHAYDAGGILLSAMQAASTHEEDGSLSFGRQALREAMQSISGYQGVTGRLSCNRFGDCGQARFKIVRLDHPGAGFEQLASNIIYTYEPRH